MASSNPILSVQGDDPLQDYINRIEDNYNKALIYIQELEDEDEQEAHDHAMTKGTHYTKTYIQTEMGGGFWEPSRTTYKYNTADRNAANQDIANQEAKKAVTEQELSKLNLDCKQLDDTINGILEGMKNGFNDAGSNNLGQDLQKILNYIHQLFNAMRDEAKADECQQICQAISEHGGGKDLALLQQWAAAMREAQFEEGSTLNNLVSTIASDLSELHQQYDDAQADQSDPWHATFFNPNAMTDQQAVDNFKDMQKLMVGIMTQISPVISSFTTDFDQLSDMLHSIEKKILEILNNKSLSPAAQQKQIMALFMFVMSILGLIQQFTAKDKAQNDQMMSKASIDAAQMGIQDTAMQQKELSVAMHFQQVMGVIMKILQIVIGAIMTVMAPGVGSAIVMALVTILDAAGVFDMLANAIDPGTNGQAGIGGECAVAAIEIVFTLGAGGILDAALKSAMEAAMRAVTQALKTTVEEVVEQAVDKAVAAAGKVGDLAAKNAAETVVKNTVEQAVKAAAQKAFIQYFKQSGVGLIVDAIKNGGLVKMAQKAMTQAAEDAAETAAQDTSKLMQMLGKVENFTADQAQMFEKAAEKAADEAVAKMTNSTAEKVAKDTVQQNVLKTMLRRAGFSALYAIGSNNILVDSIGAAAKKKMSDADYQKLQIALQVLQQILAMFAQMVGSGALSQVVFNGSSTALMKIASILQAVGQGGDVLTNAGEYEANTAEAKVIEAVSKTQGALDIINYLESEIVKRQKQEAGRDSNEAMQLMESNNQLANSLFKYYNASSQALAAAAV